MKVREAFAAQAEACRQLGSPFTAWLCAELGRALGEDTALGRRVLRWPGDPSPSGDSVPLRLCGGLHALALDGRRAELSRIYAAAEPGPDAWCEIAAALAAEEAFLLRALDSPPQTNEVARAAVVYPAFCAISQRLGLPIEILEIGTAAGLNLNCDRFAYAIGNWLGGDTASAVSLAPESRGRSPLAPDPAILRRRGCDLRPCEVSDPVEVRRLLAYVWPDQRRRLERMRAAIAIAVRWPPDVDRADAIDWLGERLAIDHRGSARIVFSTVAWQYLDAHARTAGDALLSRAGAAATPEAPLAWVRFEADGAEPGAALTLDLWDGKSPRQSMRLGRGDFHGRWIDWRGLDP